MSHLDDVQRMIITQAGICRQEGMSDIEVREVLFNACLAPFYDPGVVMDPTLGHIFYRLTDFVDELERRSIRINLPPDAERRGVVTVEDWRQEWARAHPRIPQLPPRTLAECLNIRRHHASVGG